MLTLAVSLLCMSFSLVQSVSAPDVTKYPLSDSTYRVIFFPKADIRIDGEASEPAWRRANVEKGFVYDFAETSGPANRSVQSPAPRTEFRALCTEDSLYFHFTLTDPDVVVLPTLTDEEDVVLEDRIEMYFALDDRFSDYFCLEVDSRGRLFDYRAAYYRRIRPEWRWDGLQVAGEPTAEGYRVEGRIPLTSLEKLGFDRLRPGAKIRVGLYRAEFSHDRSAKTVDRKETIHNRGRSVDGPPPIERWITWVDSRTPEPDFHVPSSLGWFEVAEAQK